MNKKKLIIILVVALVGAGGAYKTVLAKPKKKEPEPKVHGQIYVLPKEFLINLADGRFAKLQVALVVEHLPVAAGGHGAPVPPEGYGADPQEAIVRDLITDTLTDAADHELIQREGREKIKKRILVAIKKHTDVHVEEVLFPDVTVQ
jgi:flagellar basal body-associated protein FliL